MMKNSLKILSLISFVLSIPALIVVDWFYDGYGILVMFALATVGLVLDQLLRMKYPSRTVTPLSNYHKNKLLGIIALVLFVQSPMALIFGNKAMDKLGFWLMAAMICLGIVLGQVARLKFAYHTIKEDNA